MLVFGYPADWCVEMFIAFVPLLLATLFVVRKSGLFRNDKLIATHPIERRPLGIKNLGHTCYMNSVLQGLFASEPYRRKVISAEFEGGSVGYEVKRLFKSMELGRVTCGDASHLAEALDIDVFVQQDSEELFLTLANGVDDSLLSEKASKPTDALKFHTEQTIKCLNVNHTKRKVQSNLDLSVDIQGCGSVEEAIYRHFEAELLQCDAVRGTNNQYNTKMYGPQDAVKHLHILHNYQPTLYTTSNDSTIGKLLHSIPLTNTTTSIVSSTTATTSATLPQVLVVHLKRFAFDPTTMDMHKVGDPADVPLTLSLDQYTKQTFADCVHDTVSTEDSGSSTSSGTSSEDRVDRLTQSVDERQLHSPTSTTTTDSAGTNTTPDYVDAYSSAVNTNVTYELSAVVVHVGSLDSGHYYTISKVYDNYTSTNLPTIAYDSSSSGGSPNTTHTAPYKWLKFNDDKVSEMSEDDVLTEARGGVHIHNDKISSNAYMLFYTCRN